MRSPNRAASSRPGSTVTLSLTGFLPVDCLESLVYARVRDRNTNELGIRSTFASEERLGGIGRKDLSSSETWNSERLRSAFRLKGFVWRTVFTLAVSVGQEGSPRWDLMACGHVGRETWPLLWTNFWYGGSAGALETPQQCLRLHESVVQESSSLVASLGRTGGCVGIKSVAALRTFALGTSNADHIENIYMRVERNMHYLNRRLADSSTLEATGTFGEGRRYALVQFPCSAAHFRLSAVALEINTGVNGRSSQQTAHNVHGVSTQHLSLQ